MRASGLKTLPPNCMFWDKDFCKYAAIEDVEKFVKIEPNAYGTAYEMRLQCFGRFRVLHYTGLNDKNKRPIYEGHIVEVIYKISDKKYTIIGAIGFERAEFVIVDASGNTCSLSAFESNELEIIGNIFMNPDLLVLDYWR